MTYILIATVVVIILYSVKKVFAVDVLELLLKALDFVLVKIGVRTQVSEREYKKKLKFKKSKFRTKMYNLINDIIVDLGLKSEGITVYGFTYFLIILTMIAVIVVALFLNDIIFAFFLFPLFFITEITLLFMASRLGHDQRVAIIMDTQDLLCPVIGDGVLISVKRYVDSMNPVIQKDFRKFIDNIDTRNYTFKRAMDILTDDLGSAFKEFADKCVLFELREEDGSIGIFADIVEMNSVKRNLRREMKDEFLNITIEFVVSLGLIIAFSTVAVMSSAYIRNLYFNTGFGKFLLILDLTIIVAVFAYNTYLRSIEL